MRILAIFLLIMGLLALSPEVSAQCAMCRASVESNIAEGTVGIGAGLNKGILYLMLAPYVLIAVVGYAWYKNSKQYTEQQRKIAATLKKALEA
jgi:hypothetical protein